MKPILFNTEMVKAIMDGRKTQTRRIVKPQLHQKVIKICEVDPLGYMSYQVDDRYLDGWRSAKASYCKGDILWVRETWGKKDGHYFYKAGHELLVDGEPLINRWHPSIHMPREAARIFLRVTNVRVERLHEITEED